MRNSGIFICGCFFMLCGLVNASASQSYFLIKVVDEHTGRGVPLVELSTTDGIQYYTDSNGIIVFYEPGLMNTAVHFHIKGHGYGIDKDQFGFAGTALATSEGKTTVIKIRRLNCRFVIMQKCFERFSFSVRTNI